MATRNKSAKKARNISREPLQEHVRNARGAGRKPVASIMVPQEVKEQFDCFKAAYEARAGAATNEQVLRRWMDGIGTAFDSKVAQEAQKLYRQRKKAAIEALARLEGKHPKNCILYRREILATFAKKGKAMLTREQILEIDHYCAEHKMSLEARMDEIGVPHHQYYRWKKKYRDEDAAGIGPERGSFVQLTPGGTFVPPMMSPTRTSGKSSNKVDGAEASFLTIELRTASGTAMRIQGSLTAAHLREIISAG